MAEDSLPDVAGAVAAARARRTALEAQGGAQGAIGDPVDLPPVVSDTSKRTGGSDAREYQRPGTA